MHKKLQSKDVQNIMETSVEILDHYTTLVNEGTITPLPIPNSLNPGKYTVPVITVRPDLGTLELTAVKPKGMFSREDSFTVYSTSIREPYFKKFSKFITDLKQFDILRFVLVLSRKNGGLTVYYKDKGQHADKGYSFTDNFYSSARPTLKKVKAPTKTSTPSVLVKLKRQKDIYKMLSLKKSLGLTSFTSGDEVRLQKAEAKMRKLRKLAAPLLIQKQRQRKANSCNT